ncbi:MAG: GNAT family N-acetyltransferase [Microthrixaceae bacterium]
MRLDVMPLVAAGTMASTPQPEIASADAGLLLRTWRLDDAPAFLAAFTDPAIQLWHRRDIVDLDEAETWIATSGAEWGRETKANWAVVRPADDIVLGRVSVSDLQLADGVAQVSYWVTTEGAQATGRPASGRHVVALGIRRSRSVPPGAPALDGEPRLVPGRRTQLVRCRGHCGAGVVARRLEPTHEHGRSTDPGSR